MEGYTQLTQEQRYQIYILMKAGHKQSDIADLIGVDKSTISRELRCNCGLKGYRPQHKEVGSGLSMPHYSLAFSI